MQENVNERAGGIDIDLKELLLTYVRRWWMILICVVIGASIAFGVTYQCVTPLYQARISIYVNNNKSIEEKEYLSSADLSAAQRLVNTYVSIAKSNRVLQEISETLNGEYSLGWLKKSLSASQLDGTEIFCIYVLHEDPKEAARIANAAAEVAPVEIAKIIEGTSAQVVDTARVPTSRYSPNYSRMALLGGALGALVAVVFLTIHYLNDTRIKDENDLAALYPLPVLGRIPDFDLTSSGKSYGYGKNSGYGNTEAKEAEAQK